MISTIINIPNRTFADLLIRKEHRRICKTKPIPDKYSDIRRLARFRGPDFLINPRHPICSFRPKSILIMPRTLQNFRQSTELISLLETVDALSNDWKFRRSPGAWAPPYLEPISTGTWKHFVDAQHMEGVRTNAHVERILPSVFSHILVGRHACGFERLRGQLLLLIWHLSRPWVGERAWQTWSQISTTPSVDSKAAQAAAVRSSHSQGASAKYNIHRLPNNITDVTWKSPSSMRLSRAIIIETSAVSVGSKVIRWVTLQYPYPAL